MVMIVLPHLCIVVRKSARAYPQHFLTLDRTMASKEDAEGAKLFFI